MLLLAVELMPSTRYRAWVGLQVTLPAQADIAPQLLSDPENAVARGFEAMKPSATSDCTLTLLPLPVKRVYCPV